MLIIENDEEKHLMQILISILIKIIRLIIGELKDSNQHFEEQKII